MARQLQLELANFILRFGDALALADRLEEIVIPAFVPDGRKPWSGAVDTDLAGTAAGPEGQFEPQAVRGGGLPCGRAEGLAWLRARRRESSSAGLSGALTRSTQSAGGAIGQGLRTGRVRGRVVGPGIVSLRGSKTLSLARSLEPGDEPIRVKMCTQNPPAWWLVLKRPVTAGRGCNRSAGLIYLTNQSFANFSCPFMVIKYLTVNLLMFLRSCSLAPLALRTCGP